MGARNVNRVFREDVCSLSKDKPSGQWPKNPTVVTSREVTDQEQKDSDNARSLNPLLRAELESFASSIEVHTQISYSDPGKVAE